MDARKPFRHFLIDVAPHPHIQPAEFFNLMGMNGDAGAACKLDPIIMRGEVAAIVWIGTGLVRAFGGFEKGSFYYLHNHVFWAKMGLLAAILALEVGPMIALIRWRVAVARGSVPDTRAATRFARISFVQAVLVVLMVLAATAMARGYGVPAR